MTNAEAQAKVARYPHLSLAYVAYYAGVNAADYGGKCEFTDPALIAEWKKGHRHVAAEERLNADTEWDQ